METHIISHLLIVVLIGSLIEARSYPGDSQELVGVNVGGLHADLKTNLFAADGPFAQLGNELMSGASKLQAELDSGAKALQANLNSASNLVHQDSEGILAGVNIGGLNAQLKTNLFDDDGLLAKMENELTAGANKLQEDLTSGANSLGASLTGAANALQSELSSGADFLNKEFQSSGNQIDDILKGAGSLFSSGMETSNSAKTNLKASGGSSSSSLTLSQQSSSLPKTSSSSSFTFNLNPGQNEPPKGKSAKAKSGTSFSAKLNGSVNGQNIVLTPELIAEILKKVDLSNICKGISNNMNVEDLLDELIEQIASLPKIPELELPFSLPNFDLTEALAFPDLTQLPLPVQELALEETAKALPIIAGLLIV